MKTASSPRFATLTGPLVLLLAVLAAPPVQAALSFEEGLARDPGTSALLYREHHLLRREGGKLAERVVVYRCADGTAFARKTVDYRRSLQAPEFSLEDARQGYGEGLRRSGDTDTLWVRERRDGSERSAALASGKSRLVADAGFDEFIRGNWTRLLAGESLPLSFAVPSRLQSLGFRVERVGEGRFGGETAELFRLRLGGVLRWIAPSIDVAYGRSSRRLLHFRGLSNLRDDAGESQLVASIEFPAPAVAADEPQWQALRSEPLSACRVRG